MEWTYNEIYSIFATFKKISVKQLKLKCYEVLLGLNRTAGLIRTAGLTAQICTGRVLNVECQVEVIYAQI